MLVMNYKRCDRMRHSELKGDHTNTPIAGYGHMIPLVKITVCSLLQVRAMETWSGI